MLDNILFAIRFVAPILNLVFRIVLIGVLIWIGFGLEKVATAIDAGSEPCLVDPHPTASRHEDNGAGLIKPLLHGRLF